MQRKRQARCVGLVFEPFGHKVLHLQRILFELYRRALHIVGHSLTEGTPGQFILGGFTDVTGTLHLTQFKHRHPVRYGKDLAHLMGDENDAFTFISHAPQHHEKLISLLRGEQRGGLIQQQHFRLVEKNLENFHPLLFAGREIFDPRPGVNL